MEPIRVLCVMDTLVRAGAETMCMNIYRNIDRSKVQFDFIKHAEPKEAYEDEILQMGGRIFCAPRYKLYNHFSYCNWWKKHLNEHPEHQIIHGHFYTIAMAYLSVAKKMNRITIQHCHSATVKGKGILRLIKNYVAHRGGIMLITVLHAL